MRYETVEIEGEAFEIYEGSSLITHHYEDGVCLMIDNVVSDLRTSCVAAFATIGPRGGRRDLAFRFKEDDVSEWQGRLHDARVDLQRVEAWRQEKWG
jgi:hypothetical protein